jgi:hypothetical protein
MRAAPAFHKSTLIRLRLHIPIWQQEVNFDYPRILAFSREKRRYHSMQVSETDCRIVRFLYGAP